MHKKVLTILVLTVLCLNLIALLDMNLIPQIKANPDYLPNYDYRIQHNITGSSQGNQSNYVMSFKVYYTNGTPERYLTNWTKDENNPLIDPGDNRVWVACAYHNSVYHIYLGYFEAQSNITYWNSTNGINFTYQGDVLIAGSESWHNGSSNKLEPHSVIYFDDEWRLYYGGACPECGSWLTGYAVINENDWSDLTPYWDNPVLDPSEGGEDQCADPHAIVFQDQVYLYYTSDITNKYMCLAIADDGANFTRYEDNPILTTDWALGGYINYKDEGITGIWRNYTSSGKDFYAGWTTNGYNWEWYDGNPVATPNASIAWEADHFIHSDIMNVSGTYYQYYAGADVSGNRRLGRMQTTTITEVEGQETGQTVHLDEACRQDFGDIRFTASDGTTQYSYYLDPSRGGDGEYRYFYVNITSISNTTINTVYLYYGNQTTSSGITTSNATNIFIEYDGFETYNDGDDLSTIDGYWEINTVQETLEVDSDSGNVFETKALMVDDDDTSNKNDYNWNFTDQSTDGYKLHLNLLYNNTDAIDRAQIKLKDSTSGTINTKVEDGNFYEYHDSWYELGSLTFGSWHTIEYQITIDDSTYDLLIDETVYSDLTPVDVMTGIDYMNLITAGTTTYYQGFLDNFWISKYVDPEPTHGAWGDQEELGEEEDSTPPTYSDIGKNTTIAGNDCKFYTKWTDETGLSGYIFGTNNTGIWVNDSWTDPWGGSPTTGWSNTTKILNSSVGVKIEWRIWCNDTSNNWNDTGLQSFVTTSEGDSTAPTYSNVGKNSTLAGQSCKFYTKWTDETGLSGYIFGTNNTGVWVNDTWSSLSGNPAWSNISKTLNSSVGIKIEWRIWSNDTSDNWNKTDLQSFTTTSEGGDSEAPTFSNIQNSTTECGFSCTFSCDWEDNVGLSGYIFGTNNTGSWTNESWSDPWSGTPTTGQSSKIKVLISTVGVKVEYRFWCNDTSDNWNNTGLQSLITTDLTDPSYANILTNTTQGGDPCQFNCTWTDQVGLSGYIFGTDNTGVWVNESWASLTGKEDIASVIKTLNSSMSTIYYRFWCNDTQGNWGITGSLPLTVSGESTEGSAGGGTSEDGEKYVGPPVQVFVIAIFLIFAVSAYIVYKKA